MLTRQLLKSHPNHDPVLENGQIRRPAPTQDKIVIASRKHCLSLHIISLRSESWQ